MKRFLLAAALIALCTALVTGQGKTLKLFFYSPELADITWKGKTIGEVLRLSYWIAEMHLGVAEGKLAIDDTELHDRMRKGLSMTAGRDLLLLCAWAYAQRGEHDEARFAWRHAMEREGSQRLEVAMPKLAAWMAAYKSSRPELDEPEPEDG